MSGRPDMGAERRSMIEAAAQLEDAITPLFDRAGLGYSLVVFSIDGPGFAHFVSNVSREQMSAVLKELVLRLEAGDLLDDGDASPEESTP